MRTTMRRLAAGAAVALLLSACGGGGGDGDVDTAIENLADLGGFDEDTAECIIEEFGEDRLGEVDNFDEDFEPAEEDEEALGEDLDTAFETCVLGEDAGDDEPTETDEPDEADETEADEPDETEAATADGDWDCSEVDGPCTYGDDAELDALWDDCDAGDGEACDELFFGSPIGSEYEEFGNTCGGRGVELSCADAGADADAEADASADASADGREIDCSTVDGPCEYGDDAELDALWDACECGDPDACDDLYLEAPVGSRYEDFGYYCGDRTDEVEICSDIM